MKKQLQLKKLTLWHVSQHFWEFKVVISGISDVEIQLLMTQDFTNVIQGTLEQVRAISIVFDILFYVYCLATPMYFLKNASLNNMI